MCCFITTIVCLAQTKQSLHSWGQSGTAQRSPVILSFSTANSKKGSISYLLAPQTAWNGQYISNVIICYQPLWRHEIRSSSVPIWSRKFLNMTYNIVTERDTSPATKTSNFHKCLQYLKNMTLMLNQYSQSELLKWTSLCFLYKLSLIHLLADMDLKPLWTQGWAISVYTL